MVPETGLVCGLPRAGGSGQGGSEGQNEGPAFANLHHSCRNFKVAPNVNPETMIISFTDLTCLEITAFRNFKGSLALFSLPPFYALMLMLCPVLTLGWCAVFPLMFCRQNSV